MKPESSSVWNLLQWAKFYWYTIKWTFSFQKVHGPLPSQWLEIALTISQLSMNAFNKLLLKRWYFIYMAWPGPLGHWLHFNVIITYHDLSPYSHQFHRGKNYRNWLGQDYMKCTCNNKPDFYFYEGLMSNSCDLSHKGKTYSCQDNMLHIYMLLSMCVSSKKSKQRISVVIIPVGII